MNTHCKCTIRWSSLIYLSFYNYKTWIKMPNDTTFIIMIMQIDTSRNIKKKKKKKWASNFKLLLNSLL
jgi:hypothetical protein